MRREARRGACRGARRGNSTTDWDSTCSLRAQTRHPVRRHPDSCPHPVWSCDCGETSMYLCSCYGPAPEPLYCGCAGPVPPAACASPHSAALRLRGGAPPALRLRGGAPPSLITVFVIGPDYHRSGPAQFVLHPLATLEQLAATVLDIYFVKGSVPPVELRLMPSNIIPGRGVHSSLLFSTNSSLPREHTDH